MNRRWIQLLLVCGCALAGTTAEAYYNPQTGRFIQRDPAGYVDGMNLYEYVRGNPTTMIDPEGLIAGFVDCTDCEKRALEADEQLALSMIEGLIMDIDTRLAEMSQEQCPCGDAGLLNGAKRILRRSALRLQNVIKIKCVRRANPPGYASVVPFGRTVAVYRDNTDGAYWGLKDEYQAATLIHEATHSSSGTTDLEYFWQNGRHVHDVFFVRYINVASTYDTWALFGFCVPGCDCPSGVVPNESRGSQECP